MSNQEWPERINAISVNPDMATRDDIARMAAELQEANERIAELETLIAEENYCENCVEAAEWEELAKDLGTQLEEANVHIAELEAANKKIKDDLSFREEIYGEDTRALTFANKRTQDDNAALKARIAELETELAGTKGEFETSQTFQRRHLDRLKECRAELEAAQKGHPANMPPQHKNNILLISLLGHAAIGHYEYGKGYRVNHETVYWVHKWYDIDTTPLSKKNQPNSHSFQNEYLSTPEITHLQCFICGYTFYPERYSGKHPRCPMCGKSDDVRRMKGDLPPLPEDSA